MNQMIGVIGLENLMMDQGVALKRVGKFSERLMHDKAMHGPFEKGGSHDCNQDAQGHPREKYGDQNVIIKLIVNTQFIQRNR